MKKRAPTKITHTEQTTAAEAATTNLVSAQPHPVCLAVEGGEIFSVDHSPASGPCSFLQRDTGVDTRMPFLNMFP